MAEVLLDLVVSGKASRHPARVGIDLVVELADLVDPTVFAEEVRVNRPSGVARTGQGLDVADDTLWGWMCGDHTRVTPVFTWNGTAMSYGRSRRFPPEVLSRFVRSRTWGCSVPGCDQPPTGCEVHHIRFWCDGGCTDPNNLAGCCRFHHHELHHGRWAFIPGDNPGDPPQPVWPNGQPIDPVPPWKHKRDERDTIDKLIRQRARALCDPPKL